MSNLELNLAILEVLREACEQRPNHSFSNLIWWLQIDDLNMETSRRTLERLLARAQTVGVSRG